MPSYLTPEEIAEKQIRNASNNAESWKMGVRRTNKKPMERAIAAIPKTKANFIKAVDSGKMRDGLESVSDAEWKEATITKGEARYGPGLEASLPKQIEFQRQRKAYIERTQAEIDAIPKMTEADAKRRMEANFNRMKAFKYVKRVRK